MRKRSKQSKAKLRKHPTEKHSIKSLLLLLGLVIFLLLIYFSLPKLNLKASTQEPRRIIIVSPSPKPSPSPSPSARIEFPRHFGKQVTIPILTYHYIGNNPNPEDKLRYSLSVTPDNFEAQMQYISQNGYTTINLDTLYSSLKGAFPLPPKPIILTFDDGYMDFYYNAYPILKKYNLSATSFIPTGLMNQGYYLNWDQIKEMDKSGLIKFEAHSVYHSDLSSLPDDQLKYELSESKEVLETNLGKPVNFIAYPYGISDPQVWKATQDAGYLGSVGTWYGNIISEGVLFDMPRIKIDGLYTFETFKSLI